MEKIKVIGKQRFEGKSKKTGNDYNFIAVYFISDLGSKGVGSRGDQINLDPMFFDFDAIEVGSFVTLISQQDILLLSCVCIPVAGFGIGALHRLTRIRA